MAVSLMNFLAAHRLPQYPMIIANTIIAPVK
jgi:hypothetical protein